MKVPQRLWARALGLAFVITAVVTFLLHSPCRNSGYTDSRFSAFCYSDFAALLSAPPLSSGRWPFGGLSSLEHSPLGLVVAWFAAQVPGGFSIRIVVVELFMFLGFAVLIAFVYRLRSWRAQDAVLLTLLPVWPFILLVNSDIISVAFAAGALWYFTQESWSVAGVFTGLALASGGWTWVLLLAFGVVAWRNSQQREFAALTGISMGVALVFNLPRVLGGQPFLQTVDWNAGEGSPLFVFALLNQGEAMSGATLFAAGVVASLLVAWWATRLPFDFRTEALLAVFVAIQLLTSVGIQPQNLVHIVWLIPLVIPRREYVIGWSLPLIGYVMAVWLRYEGASDGGKGIPEVAYGLLSLALWFTLAQFALRSSQILREQGTDEVEISREAARA